MAFVVKNISGGPLSLDDIGLTLAIGEEYDLVEEQGNEVSTSDDLLDAINNGDAVFLDPLDDLTELSLAESVEVFDTINHPNYRIFGGDLDQLDDVVLNSPLVDQVLVSFVGSPAGSPQEIKWQNQAVGAANDQLVRISAADTTSGFLASKLVIGSPATIALTIKNPGGSETLAIDLDADLDDLNDVDVSSAIEGQILTFQGSPLIWTAADSPVQNLFETVIGDTGSQTASTPNDTIAIVGGTSISTAIALVGSPQVATLTITNDAPNVDQNLFETLVADTGSEIAIRVDDQLNIVGDGIVTTSVVRSGSPTSVTLTVLATAGSPVINIGLDVSTIEGNEVLTLIDVVRPGSPAGSPTIGKVLSVETVTKVWEKDKLSAGTWLSLGSAITNVMNYTVLRPATIIGASAVAGDCRGNARALELYINGIITTVLGTLSGSGIQTFETNNLDINLAKGDYVQIRGSLVGNRIDEVVAQLYLKWRA